jgi:PilZ domain.
MNTAVNVNVVHESEAQRQHARVRIPAKLRFLDKERQAHDVKVDDLSAGGLSFHTKQPLSVGEVLRGRLQFTVDNLGLSMDIEFQVRGLQQRQRPYRRAVPEPRTPRHRHPAPHHHHPPVR